MKQIRIGLAGNPNSGKTTIFNALTGSHQKVGNYAGVTVEKKEGRLVRGDYEFIVYDLPGTYSLTSYSIDEVVTRDFILMDKPDVVIDVLDATNLERNLYLCLQFRELGLPLVGALNIMDQAESRGIRIDEVQLSRLLGFPIVKTVGPKGKGLDAILDAVVRLHEAPRTSLADPGMFNGQLRQAYEQVVNALDTDTEFIARYPAPWLAVKLLEKDQDAARRLEGHRNRPAVEAAVAKGIQAVEKAEDRDAEIVVSEQRYGWIHGAASEAVRRVEARQTITELVDKVLINRFLGLPIFLGILWAIFQATFTLGAWPQEWLELFFGWAGDSLASIVPDGMLQSLLVDGIVGGVGGVFSFIPLVIILFVFISILEDTGYMARVAFIMDRFLHIFGLHGQSFLPMMLGFGCSVPAILGARTLKSTRDRIITILVIPFMSCGAKLPVYVLLAGAFFAQNAGTVVLSVYLVGVTLAMLSALLFRKTVLKGPDTPFVMELPPYRLPTLKGIGWHVLDKSMQYFKKAGTVILAASILIWAITTFPQKPGAEEAAPAATSSAVETVTALPAPGLDEPSDLEYSLAGRVGKFLEPLFRPLGFDWKIAIATVTGFAAKEVVVSTLGILYSVGEEETEDSESLQQALQADPVFNPLVAYTLMLFTLILAPCFAAQATVKAELGWKWLGFYVVFSILAAWLVCFGVFQIGTLLGLGA